MTYQTKWHSMPQRNDDGTESNFWAVTDGDLVIHVSGEDLPENEANADLIAAAPDLLRALTVAYLNCNKSKMTRESIAMIESAIKSAL